MANNDIAITSVTSEVIETIIGKQTKFKGNVTTDKPIKIDGVYEGEINSSNLVIISEGGSFSGKLQCRELQLMGYGKGTAICTELLQISSVGTFEGDVATRDLITVKGSVLNGSCQISKMR